MACIVSSDGFRAVEAALQTLWNHDRVGICVVKDLHVRAAWAGNLTLAGADMDLKNEEREG